MIQENTIYTSNEQEHIRYEGDIRKVETYFLHYLFRPEGVWLCKTSEFAVLDLDGFMEGIDLAEVLHDPDHTEPMDDNRELRYQSGKFRIQNETVYCKWQNKHLDEEAGREWYFRIRNADLLETDFQEIQLRPARV